MGYYPHQVRFTPDLLVGQWILSRHGDRLPEGWPVVTHGAWSLAVSAPLECIPVRDPGGRTVGWLLGHAVSDAGVFFRRGSEPVVPHDADLGEFADSLNGRFLVIDLQGSDPVIYLDGCATLAGVYSPEEQSAASTSGLIPLSPRTPFLLDRIVAVDAPYRSSMYPLGLTPRAGVERILPNHRLDCGRWTLVRRWPLGPMIRDADPERVAARVFHRVRQTLEAVHQVYPLDIALTAGRDSRMMLACARRVIAECTVFTADLGDEGAWRDVAVAGRVARRVGLAHRVQSARSRSRDLMEWICRTGCETGEVRGWHGARALADQAAGRATITGAVADPGKLIGWRKKALERPVTPEAMLARCGVPLRRELVLRAEAWLAGLPPLDPVATADVFHIEQVKGCWAGVIEYGELGRSSARLCPMTAAELVRGAFGLPLQYRLDLRLHHDVVQAAWPELLEVPFNDAMPLPQARARWYALKSWAERPMDRVARFIRKRRARFATPETALVVKADGRGAG